MLFNETKQDNILSELFDLAEYVFHCHGRSNKELENNNLGTIFYQNNIRCIARIKELIEDLFVDKNINHEILQNSRFMDSIRNFKKNNGYLVFIGKDMFLQRSMSLSGFLLADEVIATIKYYSNIADMHQPKSHNVILYKNNFAKELEELSLEQYERLSLYSKISLFNSFYRAVERNNDLIKNQSLLDKIQSFINNDKKDYILGKGNKTIFAQRNKMAELQERFLPLVETKKYLPKMYDLIKDSCDYFLNHSDIKIENKTQEKLNNIRKLFKNSSDLEDKDYTFTMFSRASYPQIAKISSKSSSEYNSKHSDENTKIFAEKIEFINTLLFNKDTNNISLYELYENFSRPNILFNPDTCIEDSLQYDNKSILPSLNNHKLSQNDLPQTNEQPFLLENKENEMQAKSLRKNLSNKESKNCVPRFIRPSS